MANYPTRYADIIDGTIGADIIRALAGNDLVRGGSSDDMLYGQDGNDRLHGEDGHDSLFGGAGDDFLTGGSGIDSLDGGAGDDRLIGGAYSDFMHGGPGADRFIFIVADVRFQDSWGNGIDDFSSADGDKIDFSRLAAMGGSSAPLKFIGSAQFSGAGNEVRVEDLGLGEAFVAIDIAGYGPGLDINNGDLGIVLTNGALPTASDFIF